MSEPRLTIRNTATGNLLYVDGDWAATTCGEDKEGTRDAYFKVQWCERGSKDIATTVMIRTDCHPQSLLDVRDLKYQGGAFDATKCNDKNRWWKVIYVELKPGKGEKDVVPVVMFKSWTENKYLAETEGKKGIECLTLDDTVSVSDVPDRCKWKLTVGGSAWSPGQAATFGIAVPLVALAAAVSGGTALAGAAGPIAAALTASGATTLAGFVGTTGAIAAGATLAGVSAGAGTALTNAFKELSDSMFVPW